MQTVWLIGRRIVASPVGVVNDVIYGTWRGLFVGVVLSLGRVGPRAKDKHVLIYVEKHITCLQGRLRDG